MSQLKNQLSESEPSDFIFDISKAFDYFLAQHGGNLKQLIASYITSRVNFNLEKLILNYLDRQQSNIIVYLLIEDKKFILKLVDFLKK